MDVNLLAVTRTDAVDSINGCLQRSVYMRQIIKSNCFSIYLINSSHFRLLTAQCVALLAAQCSASHSSTGSFTDMSRSTSVLVYSNFLLLTGK